MNSLTDNINYKDLFQNRVPVLLVGPPGVGKTSIVAQHFDYTEIVLASSMVEEDIAGLPYRDGRYDERTVPALFKRLAEADAAGKTTALFLDELDKARRSVADTLLTLIAGRRIGDNALPAGTAVVAAANPPEFGGGDGISDAMISRFAVVEFTPCPEQWAEWAESTFKSGRARSVIGKVRDGTIPLIDFVGEGLERRITSPRTLSMALSYLDGGVDRDALERVVYGLLSPNAASLFVSFADGDVEDDISAAVNVKMAAYRKGAARKPVGWDG